MKPAHLTFFPACLRYFLPALIMFHSSLHCTFAGDIRYPVSDISPDLLKNADMVVRLDETILEINSLTSILEKVHVVYTVLRESGREKAALRVYYDQDSKVARLQGRIYDASGRETMRFRSSDIIDMSAVPSGTIYSDDRVKYIQPASTQYPYTVDYEFERSSKQLMQYPQWRAVDYFNTSVESATLQILAPKGLVPRYLSVNDSNPGTWHYINSDSFPTWKRQHIPALTDEPLGASLGQLVPMVYIAPARIIIPGQDTLPASWQSYGMWINWLNQGRGMLPETVINKVHQLTTGLPDTLAKLKTIYRYFQENTRYISVQIGIGGYQPASALFVAKNGYGDCKALANYLKALLECAGIRSIYTLVKAGKQASPIRTDFPGLQFNHAILCVPMEKDTVWLECTSQSIPFGFLGSFTDNRDVLLITPLGGVLARTPVYPKSMNRMNSSGIIDLDSAGNARIALTTKVTGLQYESFEDRLHETAEEQKKSVREEIALPTVNITQLRYQEDDGALPAITESLEMTIPAYATLTGNRMFIPLNSFNRIRPLPPLEEGRISPFYPGISFIDSDSIVVRMPNGFAPESLAAPASFNTTFGSYDAKVTRNNNEILYVRTFANEGGEFPPEKYEAYHAFIKQISKADKNKVVLLSGHTMGRY